MTCCFTGHRHFSFDENSTRQKAMLAALERQIDYAISKGTMHFICGNAIGTDTWAAQILLKKKNENPQITLEIALPFSAHNADVAACLDVQSKADIVHTVSDAKCRRQAFYQRDKYMADNSDMIIALFEKSRTHSGTARTLEYAEKQGLEIIRVPF